MRYALVTDLYFEAENEVEAKKQAEKIINEINKKYPNAWAKVNEVWSTPFASYNTKKLEL